MLERWTPALLLILLACQMNQPDAQGIPSATPSLGWVVEEGSGAVIGPLTTPIAMPTPGPPVPIGSWGYILRFEEGDEDVLVRIGQLELTRGRLRQATQEAQAWSLVFPNWTEDVSLGSMLKVLVDDLVLYALAIDRGFRADDKYIDEHTEAIAPHDEFVSAYGITREQYIEWQYESYRRTVSVVRLIRSEVDTDDINLESLVKRGLLREAFKQNPPVWLDLEMQKLYELQ